MIWFKWRHFPLILTLALGWEIASGQSAGASEASVLQSELSLQSEGSWSKSMLLAQVKVLAAEKIAATFNQNPTVKQLRFYVYVNHAGQMAPIALVEVERAAWSRQPQSTSYLRIFESGIALLNNSERSTVATTQAIHTSSIRYTHDQDVAFRDD